MSGTPLPPLQSQLQDLSQTAFMILTGRLAVFHICIIANLALALTRLIKYPSPSAHLNHN